MRVLDRVVPLKADEEHCPYCAGFGGIPIPKNETRSEPEKCYECDGKGKRKKNKFY